MPLYKKHVKQVAQLARLKLTSSEIEKLTHELPSVFDYFDQIRDIPTDSVSLQRRSSGIENTLREDEITPSLSREQVLGKAPAQDGKFFLVLKVVDR